MTVGRPDLSVCGELNCHSDCGKDQSHNFRPPHRDRFGLAPIMCVILPAFAALLTTLQEAHMCAPRTQCERLDWDVSQKGLPSGNGDGGRGHEGRWGLRQGLLSDPSTGSYPMYPISPSHLLRVARHVSPASKVLTCRNHEATATAAARHQHKLMEYSTDAL